MTTRIKILAVPLFAGCLLTAAFAQGGAPSQPADPTAQSPVAPQTTPPTFPGVCLTTYSLRAGDIATSSSDNESATPPARSSRRRMSFPNSSRTNQR